MEKPNLRIIKNREFGILDFIECSYDPANRRIYQTSTGDRTVYGWNHEGIQIPDNQACTHPDFAIQTNEPGGAVKLPF